MANKYVGLNPSGVLTEVEATVVSTGAPDAGEIVALDGAGKLDNSVMPVGIAADTQVMPSFENLAAGDFINVFSDAGTVKARKADATTAGKEAHGFVLAAVTAPANATVHFEGSNDQQTGLTIGVMQFLSTTAGGATATAPTASGQVVQRIGVSLSTTKLSFEPDAPITRA